MLEDRPERAVLLLFPGDDGISDRFPVDLQIVFLASADPGLADDQLIVPAFRNAVALYV